MKKILSALLLTFFAYLPVCAQTMLDQTILFKKDSVNIMESQKDRISLVVEYIRRHPDNVVIVGGFCGTSTPKEKVDAIAQKRADENLLSVCRAQAGSTKSVSSLLKTRT